MTREEHSLSFGGRGNRFTVYLEVVHVHAGGCIFAERGQKRLHPLFASLETALGSKL